MPLPPEARSNRDPALGRVLPALALLLLVAAGAGTWWLFHGQAAAPAASAKSSGPTPAVQPVLRTVVASVLQSGNSPVADIIAAASPAAAPAPAVHLFDMPPKVAGLAGAGVLARADGVSIPVTAHLAAPFGLAMDADGNVFVADAGGALHRITPDGAVGASSGAEMFGSPIGAVTDANGNILVADWATGTVKRISPDGTDAVTLASSATSPIINNPVAVATDAKGNVYVASNDNNTIVVIAPDGTVSTYAGTIGQNGAADGTTASALFNKPRGLATDAAGNLYVADEGNSNIRKISPDGTVTTIAGGTSAGSNDGMGTSASFDAPRGLTVDSAGNIYVADTNNDTIRKITPQGLVTTLAGQPGTAGDTDGTAAQALFNAPRGVSVDKSGNIYVTDTGNGVVRRIATDGTVTTVASAPAN